MTSNHTRGPAVAVLVLAALVTGCGAEEKRPAPANPAPQAPQPRAQPKAPKNMPPGGNKIE
ncbi:MAG TPA: hypothetical protein VGE74_22980 [Gemmata sp.]